MLETLNYTIRIGSTATFLYFDLYLYSAYAAHYVDMFLKYSFLALLIFQRISHIEPMFLVAHVKSAKSRNHFC